MKKTDYYIELAGSDVAVKKTDSTRSKNAFFFKKLVA